MGEIADGMIDGTFDEFTGEVIDGDSPGYPRTRYPELRRSNKNSSTTPKKKGHKKTRVTCQVCGKELRDAFGLQQHMKAKHHV